MKHKKYSNTSPLNMMYKELLKYPTPNNLNFSWNFGFLSFFFTLMQFLSGAMMTMYYMPDENLAFSSLDHFCSEMNNGFLMSYAHSNGASFLFLCLYMHIMSNMIFSSFQKPSELLWLSGMAIFLMLILVCFLGYVLPWGQMSFWAAMVMTNLFTAMPLFGNKLTHWMWGGFTMNTTTMGHFFLLHMLAATMMLSLMILHFMLLHFSSSSNMLGMNNSTDSTSFHPASTSSDFFSATMFLIFFVYTMVFIPTILNHPDNYIIADPLKTPNSMVPEWYFLPFYAILSCVPDKMLGVMAMLFSMVMLSMLPLVKEMTMNNMSNTYLSKDYFKHSWFSLLFFLNFMVLLFLGGSPMHEEYVLLASFCLMMHLSFPLYIFKYAIFTKTTTSPFPLKYRLISYPSDTMEKVKMFKSMSKSMKKNKGKSNMMMLKKDEEENK